MTNEELRRVQLTQLEIAKEIKRICDKYQLKYIIDFGSLLGAVRHKGFIPWDDDMDISMPRADYEKFLDVAQKELGDKYFLQTYETDKYYPIPFAKIRKNGTSFVENAYENAKLHQGIYVDIFPYDVWTANKRLQKKLRLKHHFLVAMLAMKCRALKFKSENASFVKFVYKVLMFTVIKFFCLFTTKKRLVAAYEKMAKKGDADFDGIFPSSNGLKYPYLVSPKSIFNETVELPFEDTTFSCPKDFDGYLKTLYGDYMQLPPEEKRYIGHHIIKLDFGNDDKQ